MGMNRSRLLAAFAVCLLPLSSLVAEEEALPSVEAIIAQARAFLGTEADLLAVESMVISGEEAVVQDGETVTATTFTAMVKKPGMQKVTQSSEAFTLISAVDAYEAWAARFLKTDPDNQEVVSLGTVEALRMRINALENLYFFQAASKVRGKVELLGKGTFDGKDVYELAFRYRPDLVYQRYFDVTTGELLGTDVGGLILREKDRRVIQGVRIPHRIESSRDGEVVGRMTVHTVEMNTEMDDALFRMPL